MNLHNQKHDESGTTNSGKIGESPNPIRKFHIATTKSLAQLRFYGLLTSRKPNIKRIDITKNGKQQLIGHIL